MFTAEVLQAKPIEELRVIAVNYAGIKPHPAAKAPSIIKTILEAQARTQPSDKQEKKKDNAVSEVKKSDSGVVFLTADEVLDGVAQFTAKGMTAEINSREKTWTFGYRGRYDTGSLSMPLGKIVQQAQIVAKGGYAPARVKIDGETVLA